MIDAQFINVRSTTLNLPSLTRFSAKVDAGCLADAVFRAAQNHPALSTNFFLDGNGRIVQGIDSSLLKAIEVEDISEERMEELSHVLVQPFQIFQEPLFRARVFRTPEHVYLFTDMHHTISDGASIGILFGDIMRAYRGEEMEQDCYYTYSVCNYSTEKNIPLRDALLLNFLTGTDAESAMQELDAKDIPLADELCVSASARFDIYAAD